MAMYVFEVGYTFILHLESESDGTEYDAVVTLLKIIEGDDGQREEYVLELVFPCGTKTKTIQNQDWMDDLFSSDPNWIH